MTPYHERVYPVERVSGGVATGLNQYAAAGIAPHAPVNRWTYTVPTTKAAEIESVLVMIFRDAAPAPVGVAYAFVTGGGGSEIAHVRESNAGVGAFASQAFGLAGFMRAGEVAVGQTADASTGGTHAMSVVMRYREFSV